MYIDDFYSPSTQLGFEPDFSGYIPDQNQTTYYSPRDLQFQNQVDSDATQQLNDYIAQQQTPAKKQSGYIAINKGDTLSKLAQQYGTTVENLAKLNGIRDINKIKAGGILRLTNNVTNKYRSNTYTNNARRPARNTVTQSKSLNRTANAQQKSNAAVTNTNGNKQKTSSDESSLKLKVSQYPFRDFKSDNSVNTTRVNTKTKRTAKKEEPRLMIRFFNWLQKQDDSRKAYLQNEHKQTQESLRKFRNR